MIEIVINWIIPFLLTTIFTFIAKELKENKKNNEAIKRATVSMLRSQITSKVEIYMKLGYLPDYARSCIEDLYQEYSILGGNHGMDILVNRAFNLPPNNE